MSVRTERDLTAWKQAWDAAILKVDEVFLPPLLHDENVLFMCARRGPEIVAGAVANRHAGAVGLSNYFGRGPASDAYWADCASMALARFPGLPLVGYEQQSQHSVASGAEFTSLGPLRVWVTSKGAKPSPDSNPGERPRTSACRYGNERASSPVIRPCLVDDGA
jgi:hypothetical protein